jgi:hypothetical protein
MSRLMIALFVAGGLGIAGCAAQRDVPLTAAKPMAPVAPISKDAKVDRVAADTRQDAATKQSEARKAADAEKRDADYKVAIEKCDDLAGAAKDSCVSAAKAQYGKS